jgi:hypothetical protein
MNEACERAGARWRAIRMSVEDADLRVHDGQQDDAGSNARVVEGSREGLKGRFDRCFYAGLHQNGIFSCPQRGHTASLRGQRSQVQPAWSHPKNCRRRVALRSAADLGE